MASATPLTDNACEALKDDLDYHICVDAPVVRVECVEPCPVTELYGFRKAYLAQLSDGEHSVWVFLPVDYQIFGTRPGFDGRTLDPGDVVRIQQMVRLPPGDQRPSHIMVYSMELCDGDGHDAGLVVTVKSESERKVEVKSEVTPELDAMQL